MCHCRENDAVISVMLIGLFESEILLTIKAIRFYINRVALIIFDKPFDKFKITWSKFGRRKTMIFSVITSDILIFQMRCLKDSAGVIRRIFNFQKNWFAWKIILYFIYVYRKEIGSSCFICIVFAFTWFECRLVKVQTIIHAWTHCLWPLLSSQSWRCFQR